MTSPHTVRAINNKCILLRWELEAFNEKDLLNVLLRYKPTLMNCLKEEGKRFNGNVKW